MANLSHFFVLRLDKIIILYYTYLFGGSPKEPLTPPGRQRVQSRLSHKAQNIGGGLSKEVRNEASESERVVSELGSEDRAHRARAGQVEHHA